jgi:hypothetical protein
LAKVPTPPATTTHVPIPHLAVVEGLVETLSRRHISVVGEEFAVMTDFPEAAAIPSDPRENVFDDIRLPGKRRFELTIKNGFRLSFQVTLPTMGRSQGKKASSSGRALIFSTAALYRLALLG